MEQILAAAGEGIYALDLDGRVTYMNAAAERLTGWGGGEALGRAKHEALHHTRADGSAYPWTECPVHATLHDGETRRVEDELFWRRDGSSFPVAYTCAPLLDDGAIAGAVVTFTDISTRLDERRYRSLVAATSQFVWRSAPDGALIDIDRTWLELVGLTLDEATGWGWVDAVKESDRDGYLAAWRRALTAGTVFEHEYRLCCGDGRVRWFLDRAVPVADDDGRVQEWIGAGHDITERREAEAEVRRQREQYRTLVESTSAILWQGDPETFRFTYVSPEVETLIGYPARRWTDEAGFWVEHMHPGDREWAPQYCARATAEQRQHSFDYRMIAADGRTVWLRDVVSVIVEDGVPVKLVGVMVDFTSTKETEQALAYVSGLQHVLVEQAGHLVAAPAEHSDEAMTDALARIGEYCDVDRSYLVRFSDEQWSMTLTHEWCAPGIEAVLGRLVDRPCSAVPRVVERMQRREVVHVPRVGDLDAGWDRDRASFEDQGGVQSTVMVPVVADDGVYGYLGLDTLKAEHDWRDDEIGLLQGLADVIGAIIQRNRADRARRASEARFRAIAEHLPGAVFERVDDPDGTVRLTYLSPNMVRVSGIDPERALADPRVIMQAVHPEDRAGYRAALGRSRRELAPLDHVHRVQGPDGIVWARVLGQPRAGDDGSITWHGIVIDETDRMRAEEALRESRALQAIAGRAARVGGWIADLGRGEVLWSDEVCAIHEMPPGTSPTVEEGIAYYAPEWQARVREVFDACVRDGTPYDEEVEIVTARGRRIWVRTIGEPVLDEAGTVIQVRGAFQDISEQKTAEEQVRRLAERMTNTLESIAEAFLTVDLDWRFTYVNREAERLLGRERDDLLGRTIWSEYPDLVGTTVEQEYRRAMDERRASEFEFYYPSLAIWVEIHAYPSEEGLAVYFRDVTERRQAQQEIEFLALYDPLTQLPNRRLLLDRLHQALVGGDRVGYRSAALFLDLDNFKTVNDTLGHAVGDGVLQQVAKRLGACVRKSDTVARFSGDEFAIILHNVGSDTDAAVAQAQRLGDKIRATLTEPFQLEDHERHITASIGITLIGEIAGDSADDVMKRADLAMYQAKDAGRGSVCVFDPSMGAAVQSRVTLEAELREALERDQVAPYYQPQFDDAGRLTGAEALARWSHPQRGLVSPAEFIPVAEETGLILPLGDAILESACTRLATWAGEPALAALRVSVNVSARQFHHPEFIERLHAILGRTGASVRHLELELTETVLLSDIEDTITKMTELRASGIRFSLDDFGTGYSSLTYLKRLPLDQLKIDQGFVRDALNDADDAAIVRTIIVLAQTMGLEVIAEGVETEEVRAMLAAHGCRAFQGYLFGRPMPVEAFEQFARAHTVANPGDA